ncbi:sensor histidine kinase [Agromyces sp. NPDC055520]
MANSPSLSFPDEPRSELDRTLRELVDRAAEVMQTQERLRSLLTATRAVVEPIELPVVLKRIVEAAMTLADAEYGALGVISPHGGLEEFIYVGVEPEVAKHIGHLPEGRGMLGALIEDPRPIRLRHISDDSRSVGFPDGHPPMESFLGVPVRVRDQVFGNLYLTNRRSGDFSAEDEELVISLAATAGFAIENARLFAETRARELWAAAAAQIASALITSPTADAGRILADELIEQLVADRVCVVIAGPDPLTLQVIEARGVDADRLAGTVIPSTESHAGFVSESGESRECSGEGAVGETSEALAIVEGDAIGPTLFVPIRRGGSVWGVLAFARLPGARRYDAVELDIADDFSKRIAVAMELARAREDEQRVALFEDRSRIARDLHDHVIQELFATGLELQSLAALSERPDTTHRLETAVATLDESIAHIRTIIFSLTPREDSSASARHRILQLADEMSNGLPQPVAVNFSGPVDLVVTGGLSEDLIAATREMLTNTVKHASATSVRVDVSVHDAAVYAVVADDGVGIPIDGRRSGIANLLDRAERRGGTLRIDTSDRGTTLEWQIPVLMPDGTR